MIRTFIALDLDDSIRHMLGRVIRHMAQRLPSIRWVDPEGIHLTLAFLGYLTDERLAQAMQAAEASAPRAMSFEIRLSHLGVFGSSLHPRVIWAGIDEPSGVLQHLYGVLNMELEKRGFAVEKRSFSPHLTLARVKAPLEPDEQKSLLRLLKETKITSSSPYRVDRLSVMKSELLRSGASYTHLGNYLLGPVP